ncbi:MAG: protein kinase [Deltaproteobacteria bacterium]|nr:protein kinase [Deltaproteobacteria bacterium]
MRDPFLGTVLDRRFRVDERIGVGGFGVIYRATHVKSKYPVALKILNPVMSRDERIVARFKREAATVTSLRSPHTVTTYELVEEDNGNLFMVMELLRGETLLHRFRREGPLPWRKVVAIGRAVCESLAEAHGLGVVHRDLKPENIHLEPAPEPDFVKVLDFGIAKVLRGSELDGAGEELTKHNEVVGTFDYVSPEQIMGETDSGQSDLYTLGVVMYEMLTGTRPFAHATGAALLAAIVTTTPTPPSVRVPGTPAELDAVVLRCLEHEPPRRYQDVGELAAALDVLLDGQDEGATRNISVADLARPRRGEPPADTDEHPGDEATLVSDRPLQPALDTDGDLEPPTIAEGAHRQLPTPTPTIEPPPPRMPSTVRRATSVPPPTPPQASERSPSRRLAAAPPPIPRAPTTPPRGSQEGPTQPQPHPPYATPSPGTVPAMSYGAPPFAPGQPAPFTPGPSSRTYSTLDGWGAPPRTNPGAATREPTPAPVAQEPSRVAVWIVVFAAALVVGVLLAVLA